MAPRSYQKGSMKKYYIQFDNDANYVVKALDEESAEVEARAKFFYDFDESGTIVKCYETNLKCSA